MCKFMYMNSCDPTFSLALCVTRNPKAGADLGCGDWLGDTPFHIAVTFGHVDMFLDLTELAKVSYDEYMIEA